VQTGSGAVGGWKAALLEGKTQKERERDERERQRVLLDEDYEDPDARADSYVRQRVQGLPLAAAALAAEGAVPDDAAQRIARLVRARQEAAAADMDVGGDADEGNKVVFNDTIEFSNFLQSRLLAERDREEEEADAVAVAAAAKQEAAPAAKTNAAEAMEVDEAPAAASADPVATSAAAPTMPPPTADADAGAAAPAAGQSLVGRKRRRFEDADAATGPGIAMGTVAAKKIGGWRAASDADADDHEDAQGAMASDAEDGMGGAGEDDEEHTAAAEAKMQQRGVAAALSLFQNAGALKAKERYSGRAKDVRPEQLLRQVGGAAPAAPGTKEITLEYRDADGNKLTTKQAYRELSYKFHGHMPSQKTREKRMRQMEREQERERHAVGVPTTIAALQQRQEASGSAYIALGK
jgi:hypothetical protein